MLLFFHVLHSVKLKKLFPMFGFGVKYGHFVCVVSLQLWNVYRLPIELAGLECDHHHANFRFHVYNCTQTFLIVPLLLPGKFAKECTIVDLVDPF